MALPSPKKFLGMMKVCSHFCCDRFGAKLVGVVLGDKLGAWSKSCLFLAIWLLTVVGRYGVDQTQGLWGFPERSGCLDRVTLQVGGLYEQLRPGVTPAGQGQF